MKASNRVNVSQRAVSPKNLAYAQARNQLGTPGLAKSSLRGAQIF